MKKTVFSLLFVISAFSSFSQDLSGTWAWDSDNDENSLELILSTESKLDLLGSYCAVFQKGNKIDCNDSTEAPNIYLRQSGPNTFEGTFRSSFSNTSGQLKLISLDSDKLQLGVISEPSGEYYLPKSVFLERVSKKERE